MNTDYLIKVNEREHAILNDLYDYRVMTTEQIKKLHFNNRGYYVNKVLMKMRKKGLIKTSTLKGSRKGRKGFSYHRMTETGLSRLQRSDKFVEGQSSLYVKPRQVPYLLMLVDLLAELRETGWEVWDSRRVKDEYNLDPRMNIQGLVISPENKRYGLYILPENTTPQTLGKIHSEIALNVNNLLNDYLILSNGQLTFYEFVDRAIDPPILSNGKKPKPLNTGHSIKVYPFKMFTIKANAFQSEKEWIEKLCSHYGFKLLSMNKNETRQSFPIIVEYKGKEWYLVDLTDSDIQKYHDIEIYSKSNSNRRWEQRDIIAISLSVATQANKSLEERPSVLYYKLTSDEFIQLCTK